ncbi:MAG: family 43 glycosylhydrolase [Bacteroidales bacterium]|nr:family 43 glycosylhydrolase [Bacteroidales bacterium]
MKKTFIILALILPACLCYAQNPIITTAYTPDPAPFAHGDKLYMFTGHDEDDATYFKMKDWMLYSTEDMVNWTYLGTPVSTATFDWAFQGDRAWASQAVERNGKWYWYVCLTEAATNADALAVAVADHPQGPYKDAIGGPLATGWSFIDPTVFIDKDNSAYLFWGNKGCWYGKLGNDMVSFENGYKEVPGFHDPACFGPESMKMNWAKGREEMMVGYEEGPWVSRRGDIYYMTYPAGGVPEHMAYSTAPSIDGPWTYRGRIMDEAENAFTIHGGEVEFKGRNYMFYHNGALPNGGGFHRSACVEEFTYNEDGTIPFIPFTKHGPRPVGAVNPYNRVEAETMAWSWGVKTDRLAGFKHYVTQIHNGDWIKIREVDFGQDSPGEIELEILNFRTPGVVEFYVDALGGNPFASFDIRDSGAMETSIARPVTGLHDVYVLFRGGDDQLFDFDWWQVK